MNKKISRKKFTVLILPLIIGLLIVAFAGADIYFITQGKQNVDRVKIEETEGRIDTWGDSQSVEESMEAFMVTKDSPEINEDTELPSDDAQ